MNKDANEMLVSAGSDALCQVIEDAEPYPLSGLYKSNHYENSVIDLYEKGFMQGVSTGYSNVDDLFKTQGDSYCGYRDTKLGKSEFIDMVMMNLARKRGEVCCMFFENPPDLHIAKKSILINHFYRLQRMNEDERDNALKFIEEHFILLIT